MRSQGLPPRIASKYAIPRDLALQSVGDFFSEIHHWVSFRNSIFFFRNNSIYSGFFHAFIKKFLQGFFHTFFCFRYFSEDYLDSIQFSFIQLLRKLLQNHFQGFFSRNFSRNPRMNTCRRSSNSCGWIPAHNIFEEKKISSIAHQQENFLFFLRKSALEFAFCSACFFFCFC